MYYFIGFLVVYVVLSSLLISWAVKRFNKEMEGREYWPSDVKYYLNKHFPLVWKIQTSDPEVVAEFQALRQGVGHMLTLLGITLGVATIVALYA